MKSLPDSVRLMAQFVAMALMFWSMFGFQNSEKMPGVSDMNEV